MRERNRKLTTERGLWRWKGFRLKSTTAEWERMKYWSINPCLDSTCVPFCQCNYDSKCHFPIKLSVVSVQSFGFLLIYHRIFLSGLDHFYHHHTFITCEWANVRKTRARGRKWETKDWINHEEVWLPHDYRCISLTIAKRPQSSLPAGINSLENYSMWIICVPGKMCTGNSSFDLV